MIWCGFCLAVIGGWREWFNIVAASADRLIDFQFLIKDGLFDVARQGLLAHIEAFGWCHKSAYLLGWASISLDRNEEAVDALSRALQFNPRDGDCYSNLALAYLRQSKIEDALNAFDEAKHLVPQTPSMWNNYGLTLKAAGRFPEALDAFEKAIAIDANFANAISNLGCLLSDNQDHRAAIHNLQKVVEMQPNRPDFRYNLAKALYKFRDQLEDMDAEEQAISMYSSVIEMNPRDTRALFNLGEIFREKDLLPDAAAHYRRALSVDPSHAPTRAFLAHTLAKMCAWDELDQIAQVSVETGITGRPIPPWLALSWEDNPEKQMLRSINWAKDRCGNIESRTSVSLTRTAGQRIRVGYFSADFHQSHATMHLLREIFKHSDVSRFEVHIFSYGCNPVEKKIFIDSGVSRFHEIGRLSDRQIVELADECQLDIAVDLKGYTGGSRIELFARRLAPVQIGFLGYPGTSGADFMDYMIADQVVLPPEKWESQATEKPLYLPCYQPNCELRDAGEKIGQRSDHGLPEAALVLCVFNGSFKISRELFRCWAAIVLELPSAVLWILESNPWMRNNLISESLRLGLSPDKLVFAPPIEKELHIARMSHADLFLDTWNVNGHTSVSDALRSRVPVLTKRGEQFASRVAASLLTRVGMTELICESEAEYVDKAIALCSDREKLGALKEELSINIKKSDLFNPGLFSRRLERLYLSTLSTDENSEAFKCSHDRPKHSQRTLK